MTFYLVLVLSIMLVAIAVATVAMKTLRSAIILLSTLSLLVSIMFLLIAAPDVAITEAALGSALTTIIFVVAFSHVGNCREEKRTSPFHAADRSAASVRAGKGAKEEASAT